MILIRRKFTVGRAFAVSRRTSLLRYSEHSLDAANRAAHGSSDRTAYNTSDWARCSIAFGSPVLRAANDALRLRCQGHGENREDASNQYQVRSHMLALK